MRRAASLEAPAWNTLGPTPGASCGVKRSLQGMVSLWGRTRTTTMPLHSVQKRICSANPTRAEGSCQCGAPTLTVVSGCSRALGKTSWRPCTDASSELAHSGPTVADALSRGDARLVSQLRSTAQGPGELGPPHALCSREEAQRAQRAPPGLGHALPGLNTTAAHYGQPAPSQGRSV